MHTKGKSWKTYFIMNKLCMNHLTICVLCMNCYCLLMGQRVCSVGLCFLTILLLFVAFFVFMCVLQKRHANKNTKLSILFYLLCDAIVDL